jgi:hypothetical protein
MTSARARRQSYLGGSSRASAVGVPRWHSGGPGAAVPSTCADGGAYYLLGASLERGDGYRVLSEPGNLPRSLHPPVSRRSHRCRARPNVSRMPALGRTGRKQTRRSSSVSARAGGRRRLAQSAAIPTSREKLHHLRVVAWDVRRHNQDEPAACRCCRADGCIHREHRGIENVNACSSAR